MSLSQAAAVETMYMLRLFARTRVPINPNEYENNLMFGDDLMVGFFLFSDSLVHFRFS